MVVEEFGLEENVFPFLLRALGPAQSILQGQILSDRVPVLARQSLVLVLRRSLPSLVPLAPSAQPPSPSTSFSLRPTAFSCRPTASSQYLTALCASLTLSSIPSISCLASNPSSLWSSVSWRVVSTTRRAVRSPFVEFETSCSVVWEWESTAECDSKVECEPRFRAEGSPDPNTETRWVAIFGFS